MSKKGLPKLPQSIKVRIIKTKEGVFIGELVEYDVFTEANSLQELDFNINDLICSFFDVPKKYYGKFVYRRAIQHREDVARIKDPVAFRIFCTPDFCNSYSWA